MRGAVAICCGALLAAGCDTGPDPTPWCSVGTSLRAEPVAQPTFWRDIKPMTERHCARCHESGGMAPFALTQPAHFRERAAVIRAAVSRGHMPPYLAAPCCAEYHRAWAMPSGDRATLFAWLDAGQPEGDPRDQPPLEPPPPTLSRVDVTLRMAQSYTPSPPPGSTDDNRCFLLDWPVAEAGMVTGLEAVPGERQAVHHLLVAAIEGDDVEAAMARDRQDPGEGYACNDGFGGLRNVSILGGSLLGGDFPHGVGRPVGAGAKILLNIHYSTAHHPPRPDRTALRFRVDRTARPFQTMPLLNPAWLISGAMRVRANDPDAVFHYQYAPRVLTGNRRVWLYNVTPHMHEFASRQRVMVIRQDGTRACLLEIPAWRFGWEQPFWFARPLAFDPGDALYLECHFDNSAQNQPVAGATPRDFSWGGNNQDMCVAFVSFSTEGP